MAIITVEKKALNILKKFVTDGIEDPLLELKNFTEEEFEFSFKFYKYNSCINAHAARIIIDFQDAIYKIVALHLTGKTDLRSLSPELKELLEVPFKITEGSSSGKAQKFLEVVKIIISMVPEKHRAITLVAIVTIVASAVTWVIDSNNESHSEEVNLEHKKEMENIRLIESTISKMHEQNTSLTEIIANEEKQRLNNLSKVDEKVEFQGTIYTQNELVAIKKNKFPPKKQTKEIETIKGVFTIIDINIKENYMYVEKNSESDPIKIHYSSTDLLAEMQDIKNHLKDAIDNERKRFYIRASVVKKNNKVDTRVLSSITKHNETD